MLYSDVDDSMNKSGFAEVCLRFILNPECYNFHMRFDLTDLRLFLHVHDTGTITDGARRAHMTLASASERIKGMEETLGTALLARNRHGVTVTPAGHALIRHARMVLQQMAHMHEELSHYSAGLKGHIRLLCNTSAMNSDLPDLLGTFLCANPHVSVDLVERPSNAIADAVRNELGDIGIVADSADVQGLQTYLFGPDPLTLVVPHTHPLAQQKTPVTLAEVAHHPFVGLSDKSALQEHLAYHARKSGKQLHYRIRLHHIDTVCLMVTYNIGIAVVPAIVAQRHTLSGKLHMVPLKDAWANRNLLLCVRPAEELPAYVNLLLAHLRPATQS